LPINIRLCAGLRIYFVLWLTQFLCGSMFLSVALVK
jgi:hypothetical protein